MKKKQLNEVNLIRAFAILSVVVGHSIIVYSNHWNYYEMRLPSGMLNSLKEIINLYQMPLFISISGYLFSYISLEKKSVSGNFFEFVKNKFRRLIPSFLIIGIIYLIPLRLMGEYSNYVQNSFIFNLFYNLLWGNDSGHLWFLPTLFIIFIIFYFVNRLDNTKKYLQLILCSIFFVAPLVVHIDFIPFPFVNFALMYSIYFYVGYLIRIYHKNLLTTNLLFVFVIYIIILLGDLFIQKSMTFSGVLKLAIDYGLTSAQQIYILGMIYTVFLKINKNFSYEKKSIVSFLSDNSYGIYLFHSPLIYPVLNFYDDYHVNPYIFSVLLFAFIFTLSSILTIICRRIRILNIVIGE